MATAGVAEDATHEVEVTPKVTWPTRGPRFDLPSAPPEMVGGAPQVMGWIPRHELPAITADGKTVVHVEESVTADARYTLDLVWRNVADAKASRRITVQDAAPGATLAPDATLAGRLERANAMLAQEPLTPMRPMQRSGVGVSLWDQRVVMAASMRGGRLVFHDGDLTLHDVARGFEPVALPPCSTVGSGAREADCGCELRARLTAGGWSAEHRVAFAAAQMEAPACTTSLARVALAVLPAPAPFVATQPPPYLETPTFLPAPYEGHDYVFANWPPAVGLPAISEDGKTIAWIDGGALWHVAASFFERRDVVRDRVIERVQIVGREGDPIDRDPAAYLRAIAERVSQVNAVLAATRWTPLVFLTRVMDTDPAGGRDGFGDMVMSDGPVVFRNDTVAPRISVSFEKSKLSVSLDDTLVFSEVDKRWSERPVPCTGARSKACDCRFDPQLYQVDWSPERRVLWILIGSRGSKGCEEPDQWVAVKLPTVKARRP